MYSYVPDELAGLFESLFTVLAAVCERTAVNVFLVVSGTTAERPVEGENTTKCQVEDHQNQGCNKRKVIIN